MRRREVKPKEQTTPLLTRRSAGTKQKQTGRKKCTGLIWGVSIFLFLLYIVVPVYFYQSVWLRSHLVFLTFLNWPPFINLSAPHDFGLNCTRNFYLDSEPGVKLGVWHIMPQSRSAKCDPQKIPSSQAFDDDRPVFLYFHGNSGSRGGGHRVDLYKVLTQSHLDAHVVTFDYRGYGDSATDGPVTAAGVVHDAAFVYSWLTSQVDRSRVIIWGHSLGTGVAVQVAESLCRKREEPAGVVLESPFDVLSGVAKHHFLSFFHRYMPFFEDIFVEPIKKAETHFDSETRIGGVTCPLMILHAEDDFIVPHFLGKHLHERALSDRPRNSLPAEMLSFEASLGYGHKHIHREPGLPDIVKRFLKKTVASGRTGT